MSGSKVSPQPRFVAYLAVLPFYRERCMRLLTSALGGDFQAFAGDRHIDATVRTGISHGMYAPVLNLRFGGALFQIGGWSRVIKAEVAILDLNPRSLSAWILLLLRRGLGRRTLLWGHLHPRSGAGSRTKALREKMRSLGHGTILYGYDSVVPALTSLPANPVWVAPNSLYDAEEMLPAQLDSDSNRFVYVGRLVGEKKVHLAIRAIERLVQAGRNVGLDIVGQGEDESMLRDLAYELRVSANVTFHGQMADPVDLFNVYSRSVAALSPGYAGLSLTQSVGFGVPILVAREEPHAPEIELARLGGVEFFESDDVDSLAQTMLGALEHAGTQDRKALSERVRGAYSAAAMAEGLIRALQEAPQEIDSSGWPTGLGTHLG